MEINESAGVIGRGTDAREQFQVSASSTEGTTSANGVVGTGVEEEVGVINGDNQVSSQVQIEGISEEGVSEDEKGLDVYVQASLGHNLAAYNGLTIARKYPKCYQKFTEYCSTKSGPEQMDDETVLGVILAAPRTVFPDFFDQNGVFVNTEYSGKWAFDVKTKNTMEHSAFKYDTRVLAEIDGFYRAFQILEEKLA